MGTYKFTDTWYQDYTIEADTEDEARRLAADHELDVSELDFGGTDMDHDAMEGNA